MRPSRETFEAAAPGHGVCLNTCDSPLCGARPCVCFFSSVSGALFCVFYIFLFAVRCCVFFVFLSGVPPFFFSSPSMYAARAFFVALPVTRPCFFWSPSMSAARAFLSSF